MNLQAASGEWEYSRGSERDDLPVARSYQYSPTIPTNAGGSAEQVLWIRYRGAAAGRAVLSLTGRWSSLRVYEGTALRHDERRLTNYEPIAPTRWYPVSLAEPLHIRMHIPAGVNPVVSLAGFPSRQTPAYLLVPAMVAMSALLLLVLLAAYALLARRAEIFIAVSLAIVASYGASLVAGVITGVPVSPVVPAAAVVMLSPTPLLARMRRAGALSAGLWVLALAGLLASATLFTVNSYFFLSFHYLVPFCMAALAPFVLAHVLRPGAGGRGLAVLLLLLVSGIAIGILRLDPVAHPLLFAAAALILSAALLLVRMVSYYRERAAADAAARHAAAESALLAKRQRELEERLDAGERTMQKEVSELQQVYAASLAGISVAGWQGGAVNPTHEASAEVFSAIALDDIFVAAVFRTEQRNSFTAGTVAALALDRVLVPGEKLAETARRLDHALHEHGMRWSGALVKVRGEYAEFYSRKHEPPLFVSAARRRVVRLSDAGFAADAGMFRIPPGDAIILASDESVRLLLAGAAVPSGPKGLQLTRLESMVRECAQGNVTQAMIMLRNGEQ